MIFIALALAQGASPAGQTNQGTYEINLHQVSTLTGLTIGISVTIAVIVLLGYILIKAGVVRLGSGGGADDQKASPGSPILPFQVTMCNEHMAEKERSKRNEDEIHKLWEFTSKTSTETRDGIASLHRNQLRLMTGLVESGFLKKHSLPDDIGNPKGKRDKED
jgi:hypothetical protein